MLLINTNFLPHTAQSESEIKTIQSMLFMKNKSLRKVSNIRDKLTMCKPLIQKSVQNAMLSQGSPIFRGVYGVNLNIIRKNMNIAYFISPVSYCFKGRMI
jgi:hypothetical protein